MSSTNVTATLLENHERELALVTGQVYELTERRKELLAIVATLRAVQTAEKNAEEAALNRAAKAQ